MNVTTWMTCGHRAASVWVPGALCAETLGRHGGGLVSTRSHLPPLLPCCSRGPRVWGYLMIAALLLGSRGLRIFLLQSHPNTRPQVLPLKSHCGPSSLRFKQKTFFPLHGNGILRGLFPPKEAQFSLTINKCHGIIFMRPVPAAYIKIADELS